MARMTKDEKLQRHIAQLRAIFPAFKAQPYAALRKLERKAKRLAEDQCNKPLPIGFIDKQEASILAQLDEILGYKAAGISVFWNDDPRGYALKIAETDVRTKNLTIFRDLGGDGILCPEF